VALRSNTARPANRVATTTSEPSGDTSTSDGPSIARPGAHGAVADLLTHDLKESAPVAGLRSITNSASPVNAAT